MTNFFLLSDNLQRSHYKSTKQLIGLGPCDLLYQDEGKLFEIIY